MQADKKKLLELLMSGAKPEVKELVWFVLGREGLVPTSEAARELGVVAVSVRRMCERHGIRRIVRHGRQGALVDLRGLRGLQPPSGCNQEVKNRGDEHG